METPKVKVPKRVIHCSDGVVEEYSEDEADATKPQPELPVVDPVGLFHSKPTGAYFIRFANYICCRKR